MGRYVELKKAGINYSGRCPFHNEKTPSFYVSPERGSFKCFGCGEGGDIYTFLEKIEGLEFRDVLKKLSEETGIVLSNDSSQQRSNKNEKDKVLQTLKAATVFWQKNLAKNPSALEYLKKRNFTKQQLIDYQIGYASNSWDELHRYLNAHNIPVAEQEQAGLIKKGDSGKYYDRFRDRIVFPLRNLNAVVVAFSGRYIGTDDVSAKYLNSPETIVFNKSKELFGFDTAKQAMRKNNFAVVVEGQVDLIMGQSVFPNTVATSGTALTKTHLEQIKRFTDRVVFVFDSDNAGIEAAHKASMIALELDFQVKVAVLPSGQDPADIIAVDAEQYKKCIKDATDIFDFWAHQINSGQLSPREKSKKIEEKILPLLAQHTNPLEQDRYLKHTAFMLDVDEQALREILSKQKRAPSPQGVETQTPEISMESVVTDTEQSLYDQTLAHLSGLIMWQDSLGSAQWFATENMLSLLDEETKNEVSTYINEQSIESTGELFFEIEKKYKTSIILENEIQELNINLRNRRLKTKQEALLKKQKQLIQEGKEEEAKQVLLELSKLLHNAS